MCNRLGKRGRGDKWERIEHRLLAGADMPHITKVEIEEASTWESATAPFAYTWGDVMNHKSASWRGYHWVPVYGAADGDRYDRRLAFGVKFPLTTPYKERIRVLDSLVDLCNIRWGGSS